MWIGDFFVSEYSLLNLLSSSASSVFNILFILKEESDNVLYPLDKSMSWAVYIGKALSFNLDLSIRISNKSFPDFSRACWVLSFAENNTIGKLFNTPSFCLVLIS